MCYSAMVQQDTKQLALKFKARVDYDLYFEIFKKRMDGEKVAINKEMEWGFLQSATPEAKSITEMIKAWHEEQIPIKEQELFKQRTRLVTAEKKLSEKPTKTAANEKRIASNKIKKLTREIQGHQNLEPTTETDSRVFPYHYASMVALGKDGQPAVIPARYLLRPHGQPESFDRKYGGCYNARRDNLENPFWKPVFGRRHGIIQIRKFYENVSLEDYAKNHTVDKNSKRDNLVLCFTPENTEFMTIPVIWDYWTGKSGDLYSMALITDDPPPEVKATGHDRCPVFLKEENIKEWLNPKGKSLEELYALLADKERPFYKHAIAA